MKITISFICLILVYTLFVQDLVSAPTLNNYHNTDAVFFVEDGFISSPGKHKKKKPVPEYISIGAGIGLWSMLVQPNFEKYKNSYNAFIEYRKENALLGYTAEVNFLSSYSFGDFILNPNYFCIYPKIFLSGLIKTPTWFDLNAHAGLNVSYSTFSEKVYPGITDYTYKVEKYTGPGFVAGMDLSFYYRNFELRSGISYLSGRGQYYAGFFTLQDFNTSSLNVMVSINYKFQILGNRKILCPAYR